MERPRFYKRVAVPETGRAPNCTVASVVFPATELFTWVLVANIASSRAEPTALRAQEWGTGSTDLRPETVVSQLSAFGHPPTTHMGK